MSDSHSDATAVGQGAPDPTTEEPPCAELKAASEKWRNHIIVLPLEPCGAPLDDLLIEHAQSLHSVKEKGGEACKEMLEAYHSCLRALGMAHQDLETNPLPPSH